MLKDTFESNEINQAILKIWEISYVSWQRIINCAHLNFASFEFRSKWIEIWFSVLYAILTIRRQNGRIPTLSWPKPIGISNNHEKISNRKVSSAQKKYFLKPILISEISLVKFYNSWHLLDVIIFYSTFIKVKLHTIYYNVSI